MRDMHPSRRDSRPWQNAASRRPSLPWSRNTAHIKTSADLPCYPAASLSRNVSQPFGADTSTKTDPASGRSVWLCSRSVLNRSRHRSPTCASSAIPCSFPLAPLSMPVPDSPSVESALVQYVESWLRHLAQGDWDARPARDGFQHCLSMCRRTARDPFRASGLLNSPPRSRRPAELDRLRAVSSNSPCDVADPLGHGGAAQPDAIVFGGRLPLDLAERLIAGLTLDNLPRPRAQTPQAPAGPR